MKENKLIIAAAGAGKTTFIVDEAFHRTDNVLITTFTDENEAEIYDKFIKRYGYVPGNVTIQTWFSFLLEHGVRPYQGTCYKELFEKSINGVLLVNQQSGIKYKFWKGGKEIPVYYREDKEFIQHFFSGEMLLYTDKLAKFVIKANEKSNGSVIDRISRIFSTIFVDEIQDLAGYDLDIIKELFHSKASVFCVGDLRQVTYYTHSERKNKPYRNGMIKEYVLKECYQNDSIIIDESTLSSSHRNNKQICDFSSRLYSSFPQVQPCNCLNCHPENVPHQGVYLVKESDVAEYLRLYNPVQLRHSIKVVAESNYRCLNFGKSKGKTFGRVIIYPTKDIKEWLKNPKSNLADRTRAALYVAVTRSRFSVAFVIPDKESPQYNGLEFWDKANCL